ncbi:GroES-like protein [Fomitiporia mediterranea MF3/22]|uniref:GroES-like protein n=1 Tax=Fomitiporia mediterranea (strain MF3/22) TaxID=694068 RepID=UPI000440827D|nr:GroES-like protein [Fomitiporia mediterranea MF3/22]EJC99046.1 GroES-like protein [Fomitiporia mediterranea MF3/22]
MQAAVHLPNTPTLKIVNDFEIPKPGPNQVLLKVQASGVFLLSQFPEDPRTYILGHECSGIAVALGSDVSTIQLNKRYVVLNLGGCAGCVAKLGSSNSTGSTGSPPNLFDLAIFGIGANGGHAEYAVANADVLVPVPDNVSAEDAAVMADAGTTAWHAIKTTAQVKKGDRVLITGIGGLGLLAVQFAVFLGAEVFAVDMRRSSRELALKFGARQAFDLIELDVALTKGFQVDIAVDFVATNTTFTKEITAISGALFNTGLQRRGRLVIVGVTDQNLVVNDFMGISTGVEIRFSVYGLREDLVEALDLGIIKPVVDRLPLHEANKAYDELRANLVLSRKVLIPPTFWKGQD